MYSFVREKWKPIENTNGLYQVSNTGKIRRTNKKHPLKQFFCRGYKTVGICLNGKSTTKCVHRLVAKAFVSNPCNKEQVNHIDGNKANNYATNLEWCTQSENQNHRYKILGKYIKPELFSTSIKIICIETGQAFSSIREAGRQLKIDNSSIAKHLKGKLKQVKGYHFMVARKEEN